MKIPGILKKSAYDSYYSEFRATIELSFKLDQLAQAVIFVNEALYF